MHSNDVAHVDLKPEHFLLGFDGSLKVVDFTKAFMEGDDKVISSGTANHRAPEIKSWECLNPAAADIYSLGILLFALKTGGVPYVEDECIEGFDLQELLYEKDVMFWEIHMMFQQEKINFEPEFVELFLSMTEKDASKRSGLEEIKKSKWYNGPVYGEN
mmetsp:Transcript_28135/g.24876  ORF Transcript_28135/g.24876 Transcript_28135/m.24876 type:complete len:159 (-) Transcript_28135:414-890(-)